MFHRTRLLWLVVFLMMGALAAQATIGPPVQVRIVGAIPDFVAGERRTVTVGITSSADVDLEYLSLSGKGWKVHATALPTAKSMAVGEELLVAVEASTLDADEPLTIMMTIDGRPFEHDFDLSPAAVARSRGSVPGRPDPDDPGAPRQDPPAAADSPGSGDKTARNVRVYGKVWTTRPDGVVITAPYARISIWEDDVDPNPDDFILDTTTDINGNFDITFYWDGVSEADPDLYFVFWYENGNVRVQDGNGSLYGYSTPATWNYTGSSLNMGTWYPASGFEAAGFLFSHLTRGSEILWLDGTATAVWDTPQVNCQWFPTSVNGPDYTEGTPPSYADNLLRMSNARVWAEVVIHHEFGHHWHSRFSTLAVGSYCNGICDAAKCGHCLWCNEDLAKAWNEGVAQYFGEMLFKEIAAVYGPAPYAGAGSELDSFEVLDPSSSQCGTGHVPVPTKVEGYVAALLHDIDDATNDNDPGSPSGSDQLSLNREEILRTIDLDVPLDVTEFLAFFNLRYNQYQSQLAQTALNNGFASANSLVNLKPYQPAGWAYAALPRGDFSAVETSVPVSPTLPGNVYSSFLYFAFINNGGFSTVDSFRSYAAVDGVPWNNETTPVLWSGDSDKLMHWGPITISGGRHTVSAVIDADAVISEASETDNEFGRQWTWTPLILPTGITTRAAPPPPNGGWNSVPAGSQTLYDNCDGFRLGSSATNVQAVAVRAVGATDDYDLRAHDASTGSQDGFGAYLAASGYSAGSTDFIVVNYRVAAAGNRDFGVVNFNGGAGQFQIERTNDLSGTNLTAIGQTRVYDLLAGQVIQSGEVYIPAGGTGSTFLQVDVSPPGSKVRVAWYDAATGVESRAQASTNALTDASGRARLFLNAVGDTRMPYVIFRDAAQGFDPVTVTVTANATPAELATSMASGSAGPVVPRDHSLPVLSIGSAIPAPTLLVGDQTSTDVYVQYRNTGPKASLVHDVAWLLDGTAVLMYNFGIAPANSGLLGLVAAPRLMTGGRHTQGMFVDSGNTNAELDETNNRWAAQWIWSPGPLDVEAPLLRQAPPPRDGGWGDISVGTFQYDNLDALRTPAFAPGGAQYAAVAILPTGASDHDLYLYEPSTGPEDGFVAALTSSTWGSGQSDYVLANFGLTAPRAFDVGIKRWSGGDAYRAHLTQSVNLGAAPVIAHDATMTGSGILHLYEVDLPAEPIEIRVENLAGTVDWGLTVHAPTSVYDRKNSALGVAGNDTTVVGAEVASFNVPTAGRYVIAVWKSGFADGGQTGQYRLKVLRSLLSDVPDGAVPPRASAIAGVRPNPFNPRTTIAFDLAAVGPASLRVFDLLGKHVRTLVDGTLAVGRHEAVWDGLDDSGRRVASGVYFVRLNAQGVDDLRKMVLLK
jgi:hypothetical protein